MSRKHYEELARIINKELSVGGDRMTLLSTAYRLCVMLREDNPRFQRDKFLTACGFPEA